MGIIIIFWIVVPAAAAAAALSSSSSSQVQHGCCGQSCSTDLLVGCRRRALVFLGGAVAVSSEERVFAAGVNEAPEEIVTASGLRFQDFKVGNGNTPKPGQRVTIDYVMQSSGARYGAKIDSTRDRNEPFSWVLFEDATVIEGLQEAVATMRGGGVRRAFIPSNLGYVRGEQQRPIPPTFAEYQRWKNIYANPNRAYQPDLIMDIKLFKKL
ncbi:hypothetical protein CTAYLR_009356 [Chrysophaeum taylorii]|uniref:peptidylprolyl isomerase n=1 Tax=Chrysophaeum taylorii TaxID=2483200 RepID=A0AAD7UJW3_9STRA|nr:hypothetical protein CTAYLR_009356 [Chrysophaeum taylorii]